MELLTKCVKIKIKTFFCFIFKKIIFFQSTDTQTINKLKPAQKKISQHF